ncbi:MAG: hypothetical protein R3B93_21610 [Bacteroidia bacterium]
MQNITYRLNKINTEQFAIIDKVFDGDLEGVSIEAGLGFAIDFEGQGIKITPNFQFKKDGKPFIIIQISCEFTIMDDSWETITEKKQIDRDKINLPRDFMKHLTGICFGVARGVLHTKTEQTIYNQFILPDIDIEEIIEGDITFDENQILNT